MYLRRTERPATSSASAWSRETHCWVSWRRHYIRDITRVIVESAYDTGRGLRARFDDIAPRLRRRKPDQGAQAAIVEKFVAWFRGFSAMAESGTMRAVEVATQGVSQFQTNPLIAAASGSFAGTVARKLAQDSFLAVLRSDLD